MNIKNAAKTLGFPLAVTVALLTALSNALAADAAAKPKRLGFLSLDTGPGGPPMLIVQELGKLNYIEGKNLVIEYRFTGSNPERLAEAAAGLYGQGAGAGIAVDDGADQRFTAGCVIEAEAYADEDIVIIGRGRGAARSSNRSDAVEDGNTKRVTAC